jgi:hypothetical protein
MKRKLLVAAVVLGSTLVGSWTPSASALFPYCYNCGTSTPLSDRCTCWPDITRHATCGTWTTACLPVSIEN